MLPDHVRNSAQSSAVCLLPGCFLCHQVPEPACLIADSHPVCPQQRVISRAKSDTRVMMSDQGQLLAELFASKNMEAAKSQGTEQTHVTTSLQWCLMESLKIATEGFGRRECAQNGVGGWGGGEQVGKQCGVAAMDESCAAGRRPRRWLFCGDTESVALSQALIYDDDLQRRGRGWCVQDPGTPATSCCSRPTRDASI